MIVFLLLVVVLLIGLTTAAVMGRLGGFLAEPTSSHRFGGLPAGPLSTDDIERLRFDQGLRGYRMDQVDDVIGALSSRLRELETEVASLGATGAVPDAATGAVPDVGTGAVPDVGTGAVPDVGTDTVPDVGTDTHPREQ